MPHNISRSWVSVVTIFAAISLASCSNTSTNSASSTPSNSAQSSPAPSPKTGFEADLEFVRKGQYTYIWVFSRKDGKPLDKNDGAFLKKNAPQVVDWVRSEGSNK